MSAKKVLAHWGPVLQLPDIIKVFDRKLKTRPAGYSFTVAIETMFQLLSENFIISVSYRNEPEAQFYEHLININLLNKSVF